MASVHVFGSNVYRNGVEQLAVLYEHNRSQFTGKQFCLLAEGYSKLVHSISIYMDPDCSKVISK